MSPWPEYASIYTAAYLQVLGSTPSKHNVLFGLSVAWHETKCGSDLEGNWGGTTAGPVVVSDLERLRIARLSPNQVLDIPKAQALLGVRSDRVLYRDYSANTGWYWIWFFKPSTPIEGAAYFLRILVKNRPSCKAVLESHLGTLDKLARAMYATHYFLGDFDPHDASVVYRGQMMTGEEANIVSYRDALVAIEEQIAESLAGWTPSRILSVVKPLEPPFDLYDDRGCQAGLRWLALKINRSEFDPGDVDGVIGDKTKSAVIAFQEYAGITADGVIGEETRHALLDAIELGSPATPR